MAPGPTLGKRCTAQDASRPPPPHKSLLSSRRLVPQLAQFPLARVRASAGGWWPAMPAAVPCSHETAHQHDTVGTRCHLTLSEPTHQAGGHWHKMSHPFMNEGRQSGEMSTVLSSIRGLSPKVPAGVLRLQALCTRLVAGCS